MDDEYDVVVVGAGVIGCAIADTLAARHDVLVLDRSGVASGATGRAAGLVTPTMFYGDHPDVARYANSFFRDFDGQYEFEFTERRRYDYVPAGAAADARERAEALRDAGFPVSYLNAETVMAEAPHLILDEYAGAVRYDDAGWVDPYVLATALQQRAIDRGATVITDREVETLSANSVRTTDGSWIDAGDVVVAAGWRTPRLVGTAIPIRPYRTQCIVLEPREPLDETFPVGRVGDQHLYFRPEHNGDLLVGGSHDLVDDPRLTSQQADESFVETVALAVPRLVRGFGDAGLVNGWAGVDSATPDARPILDRVDGVIVATGFNGLGVLAAPIAAAVAELLVEDDESADAPFDPEPFGIDRFDDRSAEFDLTTTSDVGR